MIGADLEQILDAVDGDGVVELRRREDQEFLVAQRVTIGSRLDQTDMGIGGQVEFGRRRQVLGGDRIVGRDHVRDLAVRQRAFETQLGFVSQRSDGIEVDRGARRLGAILQSRQMGRVVPLIGLRSAGRDSRRQLRQQMQGLDDRSFRTVARRSRDRAARDVIVLRIIGDDVDDTRHGVEAEQSRVRALHHFDLADFRQLNRQGRPGCVAVVVEIDLAAVDQDQQARRHRLIIAANTDVGAVAGPVEDVEARDASKQGRQVVGARTLDVVGRDDGHVDRHFSRALRRTGGRGGDGFTEQLFQRTVIDRLGMRGCAGNHRQAGNRGDQEGFEGTHD